MSHSHDFTPTACRVLASLALHVCEGWDHLRRAGLEQDERGLWCRASAVHDGWPAGLLDRPPSLLAVADALAELAVVRRDEPEGRAYLVPVQLIDETIAHLGLTRPAPVEAWPADRPPPTLPFTLAEIIQRGRRRVA